VDLLEYQAKELFREMGIPVLPSQRIDHPRDIKGLQLPYPVVLKSQVRAGGRGRAGGVRFVENTIDAIAAARTIFNLPILGEYPKVLLAEAKYDANREFYLAVVLDYTQARPVLLGSPQGGINIEVVMQHMQQVVVEDEFSPFYARRLALKMGLKGSLIQLVSDIIEKMYQLFVGKDLDLVEINPLGVSSSGEVMALDGKIAINDNALARHPDLISLAARTAESNTVKQATISTIRGLNWVNREGNIGIVCNGNSLAIATVDLVYQSGGRPVSCLVVDREATPSGLEQLERALDQLAQAKSVKVILINILGSAAYSEQVAKGIAAYLQRKLQSTVVLGTALPPGMPQLVVRLSGSENNPNLKPLADFPLTLVDNLDDAIAQAISLAKAAVKRS